VFAARFTEFVGDQNTWHLLDVNNKMSDYKMSNILERS